MRDFILGKPSKQVKDWQGGCRGGDVPEHAFHLGLGGQRLGGSDGFAHFLVVTGGVTLFPKRFRLNQREEGRTSFAFDEAGSLLRGGVLALAKLNLDD